MIETYYLTSKSILDHLLENGIPLVPQTLDGLYPEPVRCIFTTPYYPSHLFRNEKIGRGYQEPSEEIKDYLDFKVLRVKIRDNYQETYFGIVSFAHIDPEDIELVTEPPFSIETHDPRVMPVIVNDAAMGYYKIDDEEFEKLKESMNQ